MPLRGTGGGARGVVGIGEAKKLASIAIIWPGSTDSGEGSPICTEADTCRKYVTPKLQEAGWDTDPHSIAEQRTFTDGPIVVKFAYSTHSPLAADPTDDLRRLNPWWAGRPAPRTPPFRRWLFGRLRRLLTGGLTSAGTAS